MWTAQPNMSNVRNKYIMRARITFTLRKFIRCFGFSFVDSFPFLFFFSFFWFVCWLVILVWLCVYIGSKSVPPPHNCYCLPMWNACARVKCKFSGDSSGKFMWIDNEYTRKMVFGRLVLFMCFCMYILVRSFCGPFLCVRVWVSHDSFNHLECWFSSLSLSYFLVCIWSVFCLYMHIFFFVLRKKTRERKRDTDNDRIQSPKNLIYDMCRSLVNFKLLFYR